MGESRHVAADLVSPALGEKGEEVMGYAVGIIVQLAVACAVGLIVLHVLGFV